MKKALLLPILLLAVCGPGAVVAQPVAESLPSPVVDALRVTHDGYKKYVMDTAELVPERLYSFRPTEDVRTLGTILAHVADANFNFCSAAAREENPKDELFRVTRTTKTGIIDALASSFAYCDRLYSALTDSELTETTTFLGEGEYSVATMLASNTAHVGQHYGNLVAYMRMNGIVPPSTAGH